MRAELLWFLCGNFKIFVTMATGVGLTQISLRQLNRQTPKPPVWRKNLDDISYTSWVIADFLIKFTSFCYHGNKGGSSENLNDYLIGWPPKPQFGAKFSYLSQMRAELLWFLCENFKIFVTMATWVGLTQISLRQLNRQTPKPPVWRKNLDDISYTSWVIADFLIKFTNFCYHGNKGGSSENFNDPIWSANPQNPPLWCKILGPVLTVSWVMVKFAWKFPNFRFHGNRG